MTAGLLVLATMATVPVQAEPGDKVYLVGRFDLDGTTYNQVVFFQDDAIADLKACKREVILGRQGKWQIYSHLTRAARGFTYSTSYTCALGNQRFNSWDRTGRLPLTHTYSVVATDQRLQVQSHKNYGACMAWLRQHGGESRHRFCAKAAQRIVH
ncbi:MAG: hypothetical protein R3292_03335 [Alcanivorax sp.]|nr:hypothetical protein [Alcanivorax sp.]